MLWEVFFKFCIMTETIASLTMFSASFVILGIELKVSTFLYKNSTTEQSGSRYSLNYQDQYPNFYSYNFFKPFYTTLNIFIHVNCISRKNLISLDIQFQFVSIWTILSVCLNTQILKYTPLSNCIYKLCIYIYIVCLLEILHLHIYNYMCICIYIWKFNF